MTTTGSANLAEPRRVSGTSDDLKKGKRMDKNIHPTTSGNSHLLKGVFLGVSVPDRNQKYLRLPVFSALFRFRPGEP